MTNSIFTLEDLNLYFIKFLNETANIETLKLILRLGQVNKYYFNLLSTKSIYHTRLKYIKDCYMERYSEEEIADTLLPELLVYDLTYSIDEVILIIDIFWEKHYTQLLVALAEFTEDTGKQKYHQLVVERINPYVVNYDTKDTLSGPATLYTIGRNIYDNYTNRNRSVVSKFTNSVVALCNIRYLYPPSLLFISVVILGALMLFRR